MALFKRKADPISDRARALNEEIAKLESEIARLDEQLQRAPPPAPPQQQLRTRSTAIPGGSSPRVGKPASREPIFEPVDQRVLSARNETETPDYYNDLGMRKYDLPALFGRIRNHFRGPSATNPKLVNYLAAGGIQGLRPLRYEKRVARNRFIVLVIGLFLTLLGLIWMFVRNVP